jgi:hypothetical protein
MSALSPAFYTSNCCKDSLFCNCKKIPTDFKELIFDRMAPHPTLFEISEFLNKTLKNVGFVQ